MNKAGIISAVLLGAGLIARAQGEKPSVDGNRTVIVVSKPMTAVDSSMVTQLFFSALREKMVDNTTLAAEMFNRILQVDPSNDASLYELGKIRRAQNNETSARDLFERAVTVRPDNEYYWQALAESYEKDNDLPKLESVYNELIGLSPNNADYKFGKANTLFLEKKYDDALAIYQELEDTMGPNEAIILSRQKIYLKQGRLNEATAGVEELMKQNPGQVRYQLMLADLYNSNGYPDKALVVLKNAEKQNPDNDQVHLALADIYRDKKDYVASYDQLKLAFALPSLSIEHELNIIRGYIPKFPDENAKQSALELSRLITVAHPQDSRSYAIYGDMLLENDMLAEAKNAFKKSISLSDQNYTVWEQLVRIELAGNVDDAIKDGNEALAIFPNQAWMNYLMAVAWLQKKDYNRALNYAGNVPSLETQDQGLLSQCYSVEGDCYHGMKDYKRSDDAYDKSITYNPDNIYTLNNYAYYLSIRGEQLDKAAQMSKHANDIEPNNSSFEDTYAWVLFKQQKYADAKIWIEKALSHSKNKSAIATEHYGDILFYLGDINAAVQNWKHAKQLGSGSPQLDRKIDEKKYIE